MWWGDASSDTTMGTRFRLFPRAPYAYPGDEPETVIVSPPPGTVGPGPSDDRLYVIDPVNKPEPYGIGWPTLASPMDLRPPWGGRLHPPAMPDAEGHFDHLAVDTPEFEAAHIYGSIRFVLDVWEGYFGRPIRWHFSPRHDRLEVVLLRHMDNATAGYGFVEIGAEPTDDGGISPFGLNFDVLAHEVGHLIIYSEIGIPHLQTVEDEYFGFHEATADIVSLISVLQFETVINRLLVETSGNLYTFNELNRLAELPAGDQIRMASNPHKLSDFAAGWEDEHDLALPLTGALFDILVDIFHESLLDRGLISPEVEDLADQVQDHPEYDGLIQSLFDDAFAAEPEGFRDALVEARDYLGFLVARTWSGLSPHYLNYDDFALALLASDEVLSGGRYASVIRSNLLWREIGSVAVGPA